MEKGDIMALLRAQTEYGTVEGVRANFPFYTIFKGVPFMAPPVGENRWREPQPAKAWEGVRVCDRFAPTAMQPPFASEGGLIAEEFYGVPMPMSEDCMYLNIWTPAKEAGEGLPVAVYFHGGAFTTGLSYLNCFDGEGFNKRGIIFVTIPYRLNVFGFLAHPELTAEAGYHASGNYGLLDQIAALRWVRRNISAFGGDPGNVSVFGQSAGSMSLNAMCATPLTRGLFKRAILQSGGGIQHHGFGAMNDTLADAERLGADFLAWIGAADIAAARQIPAEELLQRFMDWGKAKIYDTDDAVFAGGYMRMGPIAADGYLFPENKGDIYLDGMHADIDYVIGSAADEFRYMTADNLAFAENQIRLGRKPAYVYYFSYVPPGAEGAHHSVEHHYVFQTILRSRRKYAGYDLDLSNELADRWSQFFKTGDPNLPGYTQWTPYTEESRQVLGITAQGQVMQELPVSDEERAIAERELTHG